MAARRVDKMNGGRLRFIVFKDDFDLALTEFVTVPDYRAKLERIFLLRLEAFDWNCPQHITPRFTEEGVNDAIF